MNEQKYLNEKETSRLTGIALSTLRNQRFLRRGLPYIKVGKSVKYDFTDIVSFMDSRKIQPEFSSGKGGDNNITELAKTKKQIT